MVEQIEKNKVIFWKVIVIFLGIISLSTGLYKGRGFWTSYVLDIVGPAWGFVFIRVQYRADTDKFMRIQFSPELAFIVVIGICIIIETLQFFEIYPSTFDPFDLLSYFSGVFLVYSIDKIMQLKMSKP